MAKIRVGQLAKELNLKVGDLLIRLRQMGVEVKSNLSTVEDDGESRAAPAGPVPGAVAAKPPAKAAVKVAAPAVRETHPAKGPTAGSVVAPPVPAKGAVPGSSATTAHVTPVKPAPAKGPVSPA